MRSRDYLSVHRELPTSTFALASSSQSTALTIEPAAARRLTLQYPPAVVMSVTLHTDLGPLKIEVYCEATPKTAENFLALCATGYYDGVPFHRNVAGFMVQTGDGELRTGKGGRSIWGGRFEDEIRPALRHNARGVVSMANSGPASNHSQFFVTYGSHPHLDGRNTVFGKVIDGADTTLNALEKLEVDKKSRPKKPVFIQKVTIHANPIADADGGD